jgi:integrase
LGACRVYEAEGKLESANAVRILCSQVLRFAIAHGLVEYDHASAARDALAKPKDVGYAAVTDPGEVGELTRAIRENPADPVVRVGLLLSAYLFPRSGEIRNMQWNQIKDGVWQVPAEQMKMKREHLVSLPRQARDLLQWTKGLTGNKLLVLHSLASRTGLMSENTMNYALRKLGYSSARHVHHGFRTTASTNLNEMGWNADWIERQLAHVSGNKVRGTYNKALYLEGRAEMMQAYANWLDAMAGGQG